MPFFPGQGPSGEQLMKLWRDYLEGHARDEGNVEKQIIGAAYRAAEVLSLLSRRMDREGTFAELILQRAGIHEEGVRRAELFEECLITATFSLYNHLNTLAREFSAGNQDANALVEQIDDGVRSRAGSASPIERAAAAVEAAFPLLGLMSLALDPVGEMTEAVRSVERRFAESSVRATGPAERLVNALYRLVEMMQLFTVISDSELGTQAEEIAARFKEEDSSPELNMKLRNGFCRLFELSHLATARLDEVLETE